MRYLKVTWHHEHDSDPVELYSELDDAGYEVRKVEVYRDGHQDYADDSTSTGSTMLGEASFPSIDEIAAENEFSPTIIDSVQFEEVWRRAHTSRPGRTHGP